MDGLDYWTEQYSLETNYGAALTVAAMWRPKSKTPGKLHQSSVVIAELPLTLSDNPLLLATLQCSAYSYLIHITPYIL